MNYSWKSIFKHSHYRTFLIGFATGLSVFILTQSAILSSPFAFLAAGSHFAISRSKKYKFASQLSSAWPEVIDHLISGISSGLSLAESLTGLATRGPEIVRPAFHEFHIRLQNDGDFSGGIQKLKSYFSDQSSDQIFEAILLSKSLGGNELMSILRTVGDFIRQDVALRKEIEIKHGWVKNSAHLSAAAPWLLLLLLSTQPGTVNSYSTPTGALILAAGVAMTAMAYTWMNYLGRLPRIPRVFSK
jgi:tight adherence protein B